MNSTQNTVHRLPHTTKSCKLRKARLGSFQLGIEQGQRLRLRLFDGLNLKSRFT